MASSNQPGGTSSVTPNTVATVQDPPIRKRKSKWLQDDGHLIGIARRKGESNPFKWNVELDPQYARFAPEGWTPVLPPLSEKKKKKKPPSTNSTVSGSGNEKRGMMDKLMFWKKKGKGKGKASRGGSRSGSRGRSGSAAS